MIRILTYAAGASNPQGATQQQITGALALATMLGPPVASAIISSYDYNCDGQLSLDELFYDRGVTNAQVAMLETMRGLSIEAAARTMSVIFQGMGKLPGLF